MVTEKTSERASSYIDIASQELGGAVLFANDDFFASKDNLILPSVPVWKEDAYTDRGKWMDGWESRRKRVEGHDYVFIKLGLQGIVREVLVDTSFFTGNFPESCSLDGCIANPNATPSDLHEADWFTLVPKNELRGGSKNWFDVPHGGKVTHVRFNIFPDGGVARLRVYGDVLPRLDRWRALGEIDLAAMAHGAKTIGQSDMYFGLSSNVLKPHRGVNMGDGWETKRSRGKGHLDWCVIELAAAGEVRFVEIDTNHFKGNFPDRCALEVATTLEEDFEIMEWKPLLDEVKLQAHTSHEFSDALHSVPNAKYVRFKIFPDGGISRLRLYGKVSEKGWERAAMKELNALDILGAKNTFRSFNGSAHWYSEMANLRPFSGLKGIRDANEKVNAMLSTEDWLEAFRAHPRIGGKKAQADVTSEAKRWSKGEQASMDRATTTVHAKLAERNEAYFQKHGIIFIVFASGKSPEEMIEILDARLSNDTSTEIENAAMEQTKITDFRITKYFRGE